MTHGPYCGCNACHPEIIAISSDSYAPEITDVIIAGPRGPKGDKGDKGDTPTVSYLHNQITTSADWVIDHNLGWNPNVTVQDSAGTIVEGEITYTNLNSLTVHFTDAFSGKAYLS
jgi:hypothetical protein